MKQICIIHGDSEEDFVFAQKIYSDLKRVGAQSWIAERDVLPGQHKKICILEQVKKCDHLICVLSEKAFSEKSIFLKALKMGLEKSEDYPSDQIYLIPVKRTDFDLNYHGFDDIQCADCSGRLYEKGLLKVLNVLFPKGYPSIYNRTIHKKESKNENEFFLEIFEMFYSNRAILLLAQEEREYVRVEDYLMIHAKDFFGSTNVFQISLPQDPDISIDDYFAKLAEQCDMVVSVNTASAFKKGIERILENRKKNNHRLLLIFKDFEQGNENCKKRLAKMLYALNVDNPLVFNILICGSEELVNMYFYGPLSLINHSVLKEWPELTVEDVLLLFPEKNLNEDKAEELLKISGGHPRIIESILYGVDINGNIAIDFFYISKFFDILLSNDHQENRLNEFLGRDKVCPLVNMNIQDPIIRTLYWKNLLKKDKERKNLIWRCELIRKIGLQVTGC